MLSLVAIKEQVVHLLEVLIGISLDGLAVHCDILFRHSASSFSLLAQRISNQKKCTLASAYFLRCSSKQAVAKLDLAAHTHRELLRDSNKRSLSPCFACATRRVR